MPDYPPELRDGKLLKSWINQQLIPWIRENTVRAGNGIQMLKGRGGCHISAAGANITIDLRGQIAGPFDAIDGQFVVVDVSAGTVTQQPDGTVRPDPPPQHEVWIDLKVTYGRVYIPRLG